MVTLNKTSERFTNAVTKLYNAFHNGTLNAWDCKKCAVGNMCDNTEQWSRFRIDGFKTGAINHKIPKVGLKEAEDSVRKSGYSSFELVEVERIFLDSFKERQFMNKEQQFNGLCAVVEYLCELEGIPNVMDYTCLFETENNEPKYKLENVL